MEIIIDTREHKHERERIESQFDVLGVKYIHSKLYVGDYMSLDNARFVIDRKKDLLELCGNITQQHERFRSELQRAREANISIAILVEQDGLSALTDVYFWHNPRLDEYELKVIDGHPQRVQKNPRATDGPQLYKSLCTIREHYRVEFFFCNRRDTGLKIKELLESHEKERMDKDI